MEQQLLFTNLYNTVRSFIINWKFYEKFVQSNLNLKKIIKKEVNTE